MTQVYRALYCAGVVLSIPACDRVMRVASAAMNSEDSEVRVAAEIKPHVELAFEGIRQAMDTHNRVFLERKKSDGPVNEPAFDASLRVLNRAAARHEGLTKQIINALILTFSYEKDLFVPFDASRRQSAGMRSWGADQQLKRRGYITILDDQIRHYNTVIDYLKNKQESQLQGNFERMGVPVEVLNEFIRLKQLRSDELTEYQVEMFSEERAALKCFRNAAAAGTSAESKKHMAIGSEHRKQAKVAEGKILESIRSSLSNRFR